MIDIFYYDKSLKRAKSEDLNRLKNKCLWVDVTNITKQEAEELEHVFDLHPVTREDLHKSKVRTKIEKFQKYVFCVFYGMALKKKAKKVSFEEMDFVLGKNFLITNHKTPNAYYEWIKSDKEQLADLMKKGMDFLLCDFLNDMAESYISVISKIDIQIDEIEEHAAKDPNKEVMGRIFKLKKLILAIKKVSFDQRDKIADLAREESKFITEKAIPYIRDVYDHSLRIYDMIDSSRDSIVNAHEIYMSSVNNNTNQVIKVLSILATITLPYTIITGIYGTNFKFLPGSQHPLGFWAMNIVMVIFVVWMLFYFMRKKWF